ncbi:MAG: hypothetical protein KGR26_03815, partial [Cyanobacteria bacterium REEB65]|nr:hypothetical protein [Cyanobacteria bacterium REEB65]
GTAIVAAVGALRATDSLAAVAPASAAPDDAMQAIYQGTQRISQTYALAVDAAMSDVTSLLQRLDQQAPLPGDRYDLVWSAHERYPVTISAASAIVGWRAQDLAQLTRQGTLTALEDIGGDREVLAAAYDARDATVAAVRIPLAKYTGPLQGFQVGRSGVVYLVDGQAHALNSPQNRDLNIDPGALAAMLTGNLGTLETHREILSFAKIQSTGWYVLTELTRKQADLGVGFPTDSQLAMALPLDPPQQIVHLRTFADLAMPVESGAGAVAIVLLGWFLWSRRRRRELAPAQSGYEPPSPGPAVTQAEAPPAERLERPWHALADPDRLATLSPQLEIALVEIRDQIYDVLDAQQAKLKTLGSGLEQTRSQVLLKADGETLAAQLDEAKDKVFALEAESRAVIAGIDKRLSALTRKAAEIEATLGRAVNELQDKLSEDLFGRQDDLNRTMEALEARTREVQRQVGNDSANAKLEAAKAAETAAALDAEFQDLRGRLVGEIEDLRKQTLSDIAAVRGQVATLDEVRDELRDALSRFASGQAEWEELGRQLSRKIHEELAAMHQRIFDREGDVEKVRLVLDQAVTQVNRQAEASELGRQRLEREFDILKGKVFLGAEEFARLQQDSRVKFDELATAVASFADVQAKLEAHVQALQRWQSDAIGTFVTDLEGRFAAHVALTERRSSEALAALEGRFAQELHDLQGRFRVLLADQQSSFEALQNELRHADQRDEAKVGEIADQIYRAEIRMAQDRTQLEDRIMERYAQIERGVTELTGRVAGGRLTGIDSADVADLEELAHHTEQLVASAIAALPDHPALIGMRRDVGQAQEQCSKLSNLVQMLLKLYESGKEADERVSRLLAAQTSKVETLQQELVALRDVLASQGPMPGVPGGIGARD